MDCVLNHGPLVDSMAFSESFYRVEYFAGELHGQACRPSPARLFRLMACGKVIS
jgi:hypothetical protein